MTDKDIIKALECHRKGLKYCKECPLQEPSLNVIHCNAKLLEAALDLINRQQAEIERLKKYNTDVAHKHYDDGIKEFAERLKRELDMISYETAFEYQDTIETIDDLVKEMGGQNESND